MTGTVINITVKALRTILKAPIVVVAVFFAAAVGTIMRGARGRLIAAGASLTSGSAASASVWRGLGSFILCTFTLLVFNSPLIKGDKGGCGVQGRSPCLTFFNG